MHPPITWPPPPSPPALRPLLFCLISDYVRIERNLSLCLLSTRNICVFALSCVIYFNVAMMMLVFATVALRQFRVRPPPSSSPVMLCVKVCNNRTERVLAAAVYTKHNFFFFAWFGLFYNVAMMILVFATVALRQLHGSLPPALRPLLSCFMSDYVRIERNLSLRLLSTRNINVFE